MKRKQGRPPKGKRGKSLLDRQLIEDAALKLIDETGLEKFSLRALAKKLGCEAMSLYHHFPSKAHLFDALVDRIISRIPAPDPGLAALERLLELVRGYRREASRHPRFFPFLAIHRMNSPAGLKFLESVVSVFKEAGYSDEDSAVHFRMMSYFVVGATLDETLGYEHGPSAADAVPEEEQERIAPNLIRVGEYFVPESYDRVFETGVRLILGGLSKLQKEK